VVHGQRNIMGKPECYFLQERLFEKLVGYAVILEEGKILPDIPFDVP